MYARILFALLVLLLALPARPAAAYVEIPYTLGRLVNESTNIMLMRVEKVDATKNLIIYRKIKDVKGTHAGDVIRHSIGQAGFHPREWQTIMKWAAEGKTAVFMHNGAASETCIDGYWYQAYPNGEWWGMSHAEPFFLRSFAGKPDKLATAVASMLTGQEVLVPCMVDGDKMAIQLGTAKIQRLKASLKLMEYDAKRDFAGWGGNDDFRALAGMPGFTHICDLPRVDPGASGIAPADFNGDGKMDFCLYGDARVSLLANDGKALAEFTLPYSGGARGAQWADYNGDKKLDLLLATATGPVLLTNKGETFADDSRAMPRESYYNLSGAAFADADGDARPDIVLANGIMGWKVYRNLGPEAPKVVEPAIGKWYVCGPFDNTGGVGFAAVYPPETKVDLKAQYDGKSNVKAVWKEGAFTDGKPNPLRIFGDPNNDNCCCYLYREFNFGSGLDLPVAFGSDDGLKVWLNGQEIIAENVNRAATESTKTTLKLRPGKNQLLLKITQGTGDFAFFFRADNAPAAVPPLFADASDKLMPRGAQGAELSAAGQLIATDVNGDGKQDLVLFGAQPIVAIAGAAGFTTSTASGLKHVAGDGLPALGDYDGDKKPDVFVPTPTGGRLYRNLGNGTFANVTDQSGDLARAFGRASGATWADLDGSGKPGLIVGCLKGPNRFFRLGTTGKFVEATEELGLHQKVFNSRGACAADINGDGRMDVIFNNEAQAPVALLGNAQHVAGPKTAAK